MTVGFQVTKKQKSFIDADSFEVLFGGEGEMKEIMKAPDMLKPRVLELIEREKQNAEAGKPARILAKMNSISDKKIIRALMAASQSGVADPFAVISRYRRRARRA